MFCVLVFQKITSKDPYLDYECTKSASKGVTRGFLVDRSLTRTVRPKAKDNLTF